MAISGLQDTPPTFHGPLLHLANCGDLNEEWKVTVLVATDAERAPPMYWSADHTDRVARPLLIDQVDEMRFYRYEIPVVREDQRLEIDYRITEFVGGKFQVPEAGATPRLTYFSCNGKPYDKPEEEVTTDLTPLWKEMVKRHKTDQQTLV